MECAGGTENRPGQKRQQVPSKEQGGGEKEKEGKKSEGSKIMKNKEMTQCIFKRSDLIKSPCNELFSEIFVQQIMTV